MIPTTTKIRWMAALGALAAITTALVASSQGVPAPVLAWRCVVSFTLVSAFQWSLLSGWEILGDAPIPAECAKHH
jgi:hypothetical protein